MSIKVGITGGASAGHVVPAMAVVVELRRLDVNELVFFGRPSSIEEEYAKKYDIRFVPIPAAGLRRYRSWRNLVTPLTVIKGIAVAIRAVRRERPDVLFSKGSYVSVPVGIGAWFNRVPFVVHESDHSMGLANRILARMSKKVLLSVPSDEKVSSSVRARSVVTGLPIREDLTQGQPDRLRIKLGIPTDKRIILVFCGSSGSLRINKAIRIQLPHLLREYSIVHICGKGNVDARMVGTPGYNQLEYLHEDMVDALWLADIVIGRAGATTLAELSALRKPAILIPLPASVSRGDQLVNAREYAERATCVVLDDESLGDGQVIVDACAKLAVSLGESDQYPPDPSDVRRAAREVALEVLALAPEHPNEPSA
jgi:UDP-N-acetylglucosamine--N-acetylmuramyl-(pentapeptide) pyrophosphoryl-undecaprenol N-acetylglucosamine transferase